MNGVAALAVSPKSNSFSKQKPTAVPLALSTCHISTEELE